MILVQLSSNYRSYRINMFIIIINHLCSPVMETTTETVPETIKATETPEQQRQQRNRQLRQWRNKGSRKKGSYLNGRAIKVLPPSPLGLNGHRIFLQFF